MSAWVAGAVVVGGVVGAVGSNLAANKAASAANNATNNSANMFNTINAQEAPYRTAGGNALNALQTDLGISGNPNAAGYGSLTQTFTPQDFLNNLDPGYQFQLKAGQQATRNADTPGVGSLSGAALGDLASFNQGMAATGYQNAFNRWTTQQNNVYSRLQGLAGLGQNAAADTGQAGTAIAGQQANSILAGGNASAQGILGATNAIGGGANTLAGLAYLNSGNSANPYLSSGGGGVTNMDGYITSLPGGT